MNFDKVIYHKNCSDGFCAAFLLWQNHPGSTFIPAQYNDEPPEFQEGDRVIIVDFSYPRDTMIAINNQVDTLVVLDHHKTAEADCQGLDFCVFDMKKSGARLTWDYLYPLGKEHSPWYVDYTEDRDLWRHCLPQTQEVNAYIRSMPFEFQAWREMVVHSSVAECAQRGSAILQYRQNIIDAHVKNAFDIRIDGLRGQCAFCTTGEIISEVAGTLAEGHDFGACCFDTPDCVRVFSLRSRDDGMDVSELAKRFGGGGHKHAAGFSMGHHSAFEWVLHSPKEQEP